MPVLTRNPMKLDQSEMQSGSPGSEPAAAVAITDYLLRFPEDFLFSYMETDRRAPIANFW